MVDIFIDKFRGIRKVNPIVNPLAGEMSAIEALNIDMKFSQNGQNFGIYSTKGTSEFARLGGAELKGAWESTQNGVKNMIVYAIKDNVGELYKFDLGSYEFELLHTGLSPEPLCNGLTLAQGFDDWFVFTNGVDTPIGVKLNPLTVKVLAATDIENRDIRGLALESYDGRLVIACENRVHWSKQGDIFTWNANEFDSANEPLPTNSAYQEFDRPVTAIKFYNNALITFTNDYSVAFTGNPALPLAFNRTGATGSGCATYRALLKFDNKLYYYDAVAKNLFAYYLIDVGQERPTDGLAIDVQDWFDGVFSPNIDEMKITPYIGDSQSLLFFELPYLDGMRTLILDYIKGEWTERTTSGLFTYDNTLLSLNGSGIFQEYSTNTFNGEFKPTRYEMNIINLGSDSNLKIPKFPLIITLDGSYKNKFYIDYVYDDDETTRQTQFIEKTNPATLIWCEDKTPTEDNRLWSSETETKGLWAKGDIRNVLIDTFGLTYFKQLKIIIYTKDLGDEFAIKRIELKKVKIKTKSVGES